MLLTMVCNGGTNNGVATLTWPALTNEPGLALTSMISPAMGAPTLPGSLLSALSRAACVGSMETGEQ